MTRATPYQNALKLARAYDCPVYITELGVKRVSYTNDAPETWLYRILPDGTIERPHAE